MIFVCDIHIKIVVCGNLESQAAFFGVVQILVPRFFNCVRL